MTRNVATDYRPDGATGTDGGFPFPDGIADPGRLATLSSYGILNTAQEEAFDAIVRLATELCAAPVGMITLVAADRQWFKARVGVEHTETPLDHAICTHALPETGLLVIPDLTEDPRTRTNLSVTGPAAMRFYAAAPLRDASGHGLGTLCVIDRTPRQSGLSGSQAKVLRALGDQVMALMQARREVMESRWALGTQEEAAARLQASEAFLKSILSASPDCIKVLNLDGRLTFMNEPGQRVMEIDDFLTIAGTAWHRFWTGPYAAQAQAAVSKASTGGVGRFEGWADTLKGVPRYWEVVVSPIKGLDGRPERLLAVSRDQTDAYRAGRRQDALTSLGERLRELDEPDEVAAEVAQAAAWALRLTRAAYGTVDATESAITFDRDYARPGQASVVGRHRYADYGSYVDDLRLGRTVAIADVRTDLRTASNLEALGRYGIGALVNVPAMAAGRLVGVLCLHDREPRAWTDEDLSFAKAAAERARLALERIAAEEQQRLRTHEVSHRFKNLLTVVQAIATQTMRSATDLSAATEVLAGRLAALGQSQDMLLDGRMGGSPILDMATRALDLHAEAGSRFDVSGPDVRIGAKVALPFSLMLHELATNAVKYGALSNDTGRVSLSWRVEGKGDAVMLRLIWRESGGPPVSPPSRKGFGSRLIERGLPGRVGGVAEVYYAPTGLVFSVEAPLAAFQVED
ncbi:hypothetical protein ASG40_19925 [Methylobacterium sp. Leaf399]|uniref:GAF domain-containing protein n=1 Tax=Methylobacterium sp. Leaf399 TaxID=1736364 RepID=UPI0006FADB1D|nr:GAF domain-containing protein [Methylobacterium sp. Leaf399]KQT12604.1 hypothetical protein ASG40_19925 [Methylobacterium sp. Leaf399]